MSNVLVCGADGQLGREIKKIRNRYPQICSFTDIKELDLTNPAAIMAYLDSHPTHYIINCAAYTDVDKAESDKEQAMLLNRDVVANLVEAMKIHTRTRLIHISTDYVYKDDKNRPMMEDDATEPSSVYGISKLEGDKLLMNHPRALVIRTSWLFSVFGKNFVKSMINRMDQRSDLKVVYDQVGTPTYAEDLARAIMQIIAHVDAGKRDFTPGIFHYSNEGICSWYDLALSICRLIGCSGKVIPIESHQYPTPAPRPAYSVLNKSKIKRVYGVKVPYWRDSLEQCIKNLL